MNASSRSRIVWVAVILVAALGCIAIAFPEMELQSRSSGNPDLDAADEINAIPSAGVSTAESEPLVRHQALPGSDLLPSQLRVTVLDEGGRTAAGSLVTWNVLLRSDASAGEGMHGTATTQAHGWCETTGLRIGDLVSLSAVHPDGGMTVRPVSMTIGPEVQDVKLTTCSVFAASVAWLDSQDGQPVRIASCGGDAVRWTGPGGESIDKLRVMELQALPLAADALENACVRSARWELLVVRQGGIHALPANVKVVFSGHGYRSMVADVPLVPLRIALESPVPIVVERLPGMVRVELVLQEEPPGRADGTCFVAVRTAKEAGAKGSADLIFRCVDAAQPFSCVLPEGAAKVGFSYSSGQSFVLSDLQVSARDGRVMTVTGPSSCSLSIVSTGADGKEVSGLVLRRLHGLDAHNQFIVHESVWPTLYRGRITISGLTPGRYELSYSSVHGDIDRVVEIGRGERLVIADKPPG
ncbi:MAG: hypothetical protein MUC36_11415 [Planctomycetes bacterium]|jgi:hypothetical protein|nr:hypothetical protein [Planctomycetota bacterium]